MHQSPEERSRVGVATASAPTQRDRHRTGSADRRTGRDPFTRHDDDRSESAHGDGDRARRRRNSGCRDRHVQRACHWAGETHPTGDRRDDALFGAGGQVDAPPTGAVVAGRWFEHREHPTLDGSDQTHERDRPQHERPQHERSGHAGRWVRSGKAGGSQPRTQHDDRLRVDLRHPALGHAEHVTDFGERHSFVVVQSDHRAFAIG